MHKIKRPIICAALLFIGFIGLYPIAGMAAPPEERIIIVGKPAVIDSGTLLLNGHNLKLWGISPLAGDQQCWEGDMAWCCGREATMALKHYLHGRKIKCIVKELNEAGEPVEAFCTRQRARGRRDLARFLVRRGFAMAEHASYKDAEQKAKLAERGIWSSRFQTADDWNQGIQRYVGKK